MDRMKLVLDMLGTIRRLEKQMIDEGDPRVRHEIAETLDILNPSFDLEVDRLAQQLAKEKQAS
jgi:hypothetical protein